jgi:hypothetical protein
MLVLKDRRCSAWWYTRVIPALGRLRQESCEFQAILGYIVRLCLKNKKEIKKTW